MQNEHQKEIIHLSKFSSDKRNPSKPIFDKTYELSNLVVV